MKIKIESLLFVSPKPLTVKGLVNFLRREGEQTTAAEVEKILFELKNKYNAPDSGLRLIQAGDEFQFVSSPEAADLVKKFLREDMTGELTPASLETLTVIVYRGPISKPALEQIRGVNCSLILRNLLIRGLIDIDESNNFSYYQVSVEFLKYLGINTVAELPDYDKLHQAENLEQYLAKVSQSAENSKAI